MRKLTTLEKSPTDNKSTSERTGSLVKLHTVELGGTNHDEIDAGKDISPSRMSHPNIKPVLNLASKVRTDHSKKLTHTNTPDKITTLHGKIEALAVCHSDKSGR